MTSAGKVPRSNDRRRLNDRRRGERRVTSALRKPSPSRLNRRGGGERRRADRRGGLFGTALALHALGYGRPRDDADRS